MADTQRREGVIALDIGGTFVKSGIVRDDGSLLSEVVQTPIAGDGTATTILATFRSIVELHVSRLAGAALRGIAAGVPGPFDYAAGFPLMQHTFGAIYGLDLQQALRSFVPGWDGPVRFRNDAEASVVGEACYGAGRRSCRLIGLTLGTGLGSSFVVDRAPAVAGPGVPERGAVWCLPWRGAIADECFSIRGLTARLGQAGAEGLTITAAADRAHAGDTALRAAFAAFGVALGEFIRPYAQPSGADMLLLGGISGAAGLSAEEVQRGAATPVVQGELGSGAALTGAAALLLTYSDEQNA